MKIKWKVQERPTGQFASFHKRGWPDACFTDKRIKNDAMCAQIFCADDYSLSVAKSGNHSELIVSIADHRSTQWVWRKLKQRCKTLDEAKALVEDFFNRNPEFIPSQFKQFN